MSDNSSSSGIGFTGLLQVAFIVLKLCKAIAWSWWWVLAPSWIGLVIILLVVISIGAIHLWAKRKRDKIHQKRTRYAGDMMETMERSKSRPDFLKSRWELRLEQMEADKKKSKRP